MRARTRLTIFGSVLATFVFCEEVNSAEFFVIDFCGSNNEEYNQTCSQPGDAELGQTKRVRKFNSETQTSTVIVEYTSPYGGTTGKQSFLDQYEQTLYLQSGSG